MNVNLVLQIAKLAVTLADKLLHHNVKDDPFFAAALLEIIRKAAQAYRDYTGRPVDPLVIQPRTLA